LCIRIEHVGPRYVVRIVLPVPLISFARYLVAQESAHEHAESSHVWEREWRHFPTVPYPSASLFRVRTKLGYNDIGIIEPGALSATPSYASEFANCARKMQETPIQPEEAWCIPAFHGISHFRLQISLFSLLLVFTREQVSREI